MLFLLSFYPLLEVRAQGNNNIISNRFSRNFDLAKSAFDKGDLSTAEFYLDACLERQPNDKETLLLRAMCRQQSGNINGALRDYTLLLEKHPQLVEALYSRGLLLYEKGQYEPASDDFKRILKVPFSETQAIFYKRRPFEEGISGLGTIESMKADIYNYLGLCAFKIRHYQEALEYFTEAISRFDGQEDFYINRGLTFEASGQTSRAIEDFQKALEISPENEVALFNLTRLQAGQQGAVSEDIIKAYSEVIERNPDLAESYYNRGLAYYNRGDYENALDDYNRAIEIDSASAKTWYNRGLVREEAEDLNGALSDFDHATDLKQNFAKAWHGKGIVYTKMKQYGQAISMYDLAIFYQPNYALAYYNRAIAKLYINNDMDACKDLKTALKFGLKAAKELSDKKCNE